MPNLFTKLLSGASNVANRAEDAIMPAPVDGLFNKQDLASARQQGMLHLGLSLLGDTSGMGLGSALKQGVGEAQSAYQSSLLDNVSQNNALKQKQMLVQRAQIGQKYAPQPGDTAQDIMARYPAMYADYMKVGDLEAAKNVEGIVSSQIQKADSNRLQAVQAGDKIYTFDPKTGTYVAGPERHMTQDEIREKALDRQVKEEQIATQRALREQAQAQSGGQAFMRQNKAIIDSEPLFQNWDAAYRDAKAGNPAAYKSAIVNFAAIADPKAQIRLGVLQFVSKIDPSLVGQAQIAMQRSVDGTFPKDLLDKMNQHAQEIHKGTIKVYNSRRAARIKANPALESYIDPAESIFPSSVDMHGAPAAAGSGSRVDQFLKGFGAKK